MRPFRPSALPVRALKIMEPTVSLPAAVLFLAGAVVTWIVFDTEPPADDLRSLLGFCGFVAMAAGCALQARRIHQANAARTAEGLPPDQSLPSH